MVFHSKPFAAVLYGYRLLVLSGMVGSPVLAAPMTHCQRGEETYFSCKIEGGKKVASLCGSPNTLSQVDGDFTDSWLQYRFGLIGKLELVFPDRKGDSIEYFEPFWSQHKPLSEADTSGFDDSLSFRSRSAEYTITIARYEAEFYGIYVKQGERRRSLKCEGLSAKHYAETGDSNRLFYRLVRALPKQP